MRGCDCEELSHLFVPPFGLFIYASRTAVVCTCCTSHDVQEQLISFLKPKRLSANLQIQTLGPSGHEGSFVNDERNQREPNHPSI